MGVTLRLSAADRKRLDAPAELAFDRAALDAVPSSVLIGWEAQLPRTTTIYQICVLEWPKFSTLGMRGVAWLAWQMAGGAPTWDEFDISTTGLRFAVSKDDASPPVDGPSDTSPEAAASETDSD
jgi:hypothetical protein